MRDVPGTSPGISPGITPGISPGVTPGISPGMTPGEPNEACPCLNKSHFFPIFLQHQRAAQSAPPELSGSLHFSRE